MTEKKLLKLIYRAVNKEIPNCEHTAPAIDFINKILDEAYEKGVVYNLDTDQIKSLLFDFASGSTHQKQKCMKIVANMKLKGKEDAQMVPNADDSPLVFFDVEVFKNFFGVVWKTQGGSCVRMYNPSAEDIERLTHMKLVGFNNIRYDNYILYARMMGATNMELYNLSQSIINNTAGKLPYQAKKLSYTDIYDFSSKKQSLKKFEIEMGITHQELPIPWDAEVTEDQLDQIMDYCCNDVEATEAVFEYRHADFIAREILAELSGLTVNDSTNNHTQALIFGKERNPQALFKYRDLSQPVYELPEDELEFLKANFPEMMAEPHGEAKSLLPYFPGYEFDQLKRKSTYRGMEVGEGGFVWADHCMASNVKVEDVASMHPHSVTSEYLFGPFTKIFNDLLNARIAIKHKDWESAKKLFNGKLTKYLDDPKIAKNLSNALKIAINSVYGQTAATYNNLFKDPRNIDNIVAKRGALTMIDLLYEVQARGGHVIHIKTDSIKIENMTPELEEFIIHFGKRRGYDFEVEHIFDKICLVNNAVYVAKCSADDPEEPGQWTATGAQFQVPYVFKSLFSHEKIEFEDMCETKSATGAIYLDMNEGLEEGQHDYVFIGKVGRFTPVVAGAGGGQLFREKEGKYYALAGSTGYRWLESSVVQSLGKEDQIDKSYYQNLVDEAVASISEFGDFEWFVS